MNEPQPIPLAERRKILNEMVSGSFEKAGAFIALIGGAGYAGLFAIWGWVSPHLDRWQVLLIAALLGLSLLEFVVWQLYGQFVIARQQMDFFYLVSAKDADFDAEFATYQVKGRALQNRMRRIWQPVLVCVAIPGVVGGVVLVAACVEHLICEI